MKTEDARMPKGAATDLAPIADFPPAPALPHADSVIPIPLPLPKVPSVTAVEPPTPRPSLLRGDARNKTRNKARYSAGSEA